MPTGLKRPYSAGGLGSGKEILGPGTSLKDLIGFAAPRDCGDAEYTVVASPPMSKVCANSVLKNYQSVFSNDAGHTMTNSTSIDLPRHWFGAGAQVR